MLDKIANNFDLYEKSLKLKAYRTELLASNIANAETPNYKAVDFDFAKALQTQLGESQGLGLSQTQSGHLPMSASRSHAKPELGFRPSLQPSLDGNTVDMDVERAAFADNALQYQTTLTFLSRRISGLSDAIKGGQ